MGNVMIERANTWRRDIIAKLKGALICAASDNLLSAIDKPPFCGQLPLPVVVQIQDLRKELQLRAIHPMSLGFSLHDLKWYLEPAKSFLRDIVCDISHVARKLSISGGTAKVDMQELRDMKRTAAACGAFVRLIETEIKVRIDKGETDTYVVRQTAEPVKATTVQPVAVKA